MKMPLCFQKKFDQNKNDDDHIDDDGIPIFAESRAAAPTMARIGGTAVAAYAPFRFPSGFKFGFSFKLCTQLVWVEISNPLSST